MEQNEINKNISNNIKKDDVVVFMKGTPTFPQCGFSAMTIQILKHLEVPFSSHDVLSEPNLREGIKAYSNWPTIPQLYIKGEFIGGCDIIKEMYESGELQTLLDDKGIIKKS